MRGRFVELGPYSEGYCSLKHIGFPGGYFRIVKHKIGLIWETRYVRCLSIQNGRGD